MGRTGIHLARAHSGVSGRSLLGMWFGWGVKLRRLTVNCAVSRPCGILCCTLFHPVCVFFFSCGVLWHPVGTFFRLLDSKPAWATNREMNNKI